MRAGIVVAPGSERGGRLSTCSGERSRKRGHRTPLAAAGVTLSPRGPILLLVLPCTNFRPPPSQLHLLSPSPLRPFHPLRISQSFPPSPSDCMSAIEGVCSSLLLQFPSQHGEDSKSTEPVGYIFSCWHVSAAEGQVA